MPLNRWILATICVVMGALQAWDSGVLGAGRVVQAIVVVAIAVPTVVWLASGSYGAHALAVAAAFVLLTIARIVSPIALPALHIVAFIPAIVIFFSRAIRPTDASLYPKAG